MDQISRLADDILTLIISSLSIRDAVKTSILSKRWRYLWKSTSNLTFDYKNMLGCGLLINSYSLRSSLISKFVRLVDEFLWNCPASAIRTLDISFHVIDHLGHDLDRWIRNAVTTGVENLSLRLRCNFFLPLFKPQNVFPHRFLTCGQASHLKQLNLRLCIIRLDHVVEGFNSITTITLDGVILYEADFMNLLYSCSKLEQLVVINCPYLGNLKVTACSSLQLKYLSIHYVLRELQGISISAPNLVSFNYVGPIIAISFMDAPQLLHASIYFETCIEAKAYAVVAFGLESLAGNLPQLKSLCLFYHLRRLYASGSYGTSEKISRPSKCTHSHLKKAKISGFIGLPNQAELAAMILDNSVRLELMEISSHWKRHEFVSHLREETLSWWTMRRPYVEKQLCKEAHHGTKLVISRCSSSLLL